MLSALAASVADRATSSPQPISRDVEEEYLFGSGVGPDYCVNYMKDVPH